MRGASFRDLAGADLTASDVTRMLGLNETLFVEHKGAAPDYQLAKAVSSFANQLGGWVLVNVSNDAKPRPLGPLAEWVTASSSAVDAVRDRLQGNIDPMPPFEARTFALTHAKDDVLVIRVYESSDTPHITSDGAIYVRGVAQDKRRDPMYRPAPIENQQALRSLVERGQQSAARVAELLKPRRDLPLGNGGLGLDAEMHPEGCIPYGDTPLIVARLAPHTVTGRFSGWARSSQAVEAAKEEIHNLAGHEHVEVHPHGQGVALSAAWAPEKAPKSELGTYLGGPVRLTVDAAGLVGVSTGFHRASKEWTEPLTLQGFANLYLAPLLEAATNVLRSGPILGRVTCHIVFWDMGNILRIEHAGVTLKPIGATFFQGEISLPVDDGEINLLADEAGRTFGREGRAEAFEELDSPGSSN